MNERTEIPLSDESIPREDLVVWSKPLDSATKLIVPAIFERNGLATRFIACILFSFSGLQSAGCRWTEKSMFAISQNVNAWNYSWKAYHFHRAAVAERLRRPTWNQIPSGSAGSNPASCEWIKFNKRTGCLMWNNYIFIITNITNINLARLMNPIE